MINFMRYRIVYLILSLTVIIPGMFILITRGFKPSIDFTGGTLMEIKITDSIKKPNIENVQKTISSQGVEVSSIQETSNNSFILRLKPITPEQHTKLSDALTKDYGVIDETRFETVGPTLGKELLQKTFVASLIAMTAILLYIAWAFKNIRYGVSAVIALLHDILVVLSVFAIVGIVKGIEVDSLFVTALLTTMSFSVHDTIIVFDRIREFEKRGGHASHADRINQALTETMGRSLSNSLTVIFMLLALFLMGGETIKWFAFALLVGTISGAYSSPFVATPILYSWIVWRDRVK